MDLIEAMQLPIPAIPTWRNSTPRSALERSITARSRALFVGLSVRKLAGVMTSTSVPSIAISLSRAWLRDQLDD